MLLAFPNFEEYDLSSVEEILWAGAAASKAKKFMSGDCGIIYSKPMKEEEI
jgi:hypothetical protein